MPQPLFLEPAKIDPADYLSAETASKLAGTRLMSSPAGWGDEVIQALGREYPFIPLDRVMLTFRNKDDSMGYALGHISIANAPHVTIPVIIKNWEISPLDLLVIRTANDTGNQQGTGDLDDDRIVPLTEESFNQALDAGEPGTLVQPNQIMGSAWTEDGSSLRLPYRGRVVTASAASKMGASKAQRDALYSTAKANKTAVAGFNHHGTVSAVDRWLSASEPACTIQAKLASAPIERGHASMLQMVPAEIDASSMLAGRVFVEGDTVKTAICFKGADLADPSAHASWLVFEDGACVRAPEKIAIVEGDDSLQLANRVLSKVAIGSLPIGSEVILRVDDLMTVPLKIASVEIDQAAGAMHVKAIGIMGQLIPITFQPGIKTSAYAGGSWVLPIDTNVLRVVTGVELCAAPMDPGKLANRILSLYPDELRCSGGTYTLAVDGQPTDIIMDDRKTAAARLHYLLDNGEEILAMAEADAKTAAAGSGVVRFRGEITETREKIAHAVGVIEAYPEIAKSLVADLHMPLDKAFKLAAAIGSADAVDSVLSTGFLTEDNLSEFFGLSGQFEDNVEKLARLLYAIRMGFPGDESATAVAMKSLQRVVDRLRSAASGM